MSNLIYLLFILLFISAAPASDILPELFTPGHGLIWGASTYAVVLAIIAILGRSFKNSRLRKYLSPQKLANFILLVFMFLFCFVFKSIAFIVPSATLSSLIHLSLYFAGLALFYFSSGYATPVVRSEILFLIPFTLPPFFFNLLIDISSTFDFGLPAEDYFSRASLLRMTVFLISFFGILVLSMPYFIQAFWQSETLRGPMRQRLEAVCAKANFKYRDLKTWGVMDRHLTAAILGIYRPVRYVLFTKRLLEDMPPHCVEAILIHEIGHDKHRHLILYPFIIAGLMLLLTVFTILFEHLFIDGRFLFSDISEQAVTGFWFFFCFLIFPLLYLRYFFGFFSRLFERQADLHIFAIEPSSSSMTESLELLGRMTGTLNKPNWHHFGIQERIDFLKKAETNRNLIAMHHRFVHTVLYIYFACFFVLSGFLYYYL